MNKAKEKAPSTAATVQSARSNIQDQNSTKQQDCKPFSNTDERKLRLLTDIVHMEKRHYQDGFEGKPYCNEFTFVGFISMHGEPADSDKDTPILQALYDLCDKMFREAWQQGRANARASIPVGVQS